MAEWLDPQGMSVMTGDPWTSGHYYQGKQVWSPAVTPIETVKGWTSTGAPITGGQVLGASTGGGGQSSGGGTNDVLKYTGDSWEKIQREAEEAARAREEAERAAAEAEWKRVAGELGARKGELGQEKERGLSEITSEVERGKEELKTRKEKEVKQYGEQLEETKTTLADEGAKLARNFRDLSLKVAMAMRASGVQLSSYAQGRQAELEDIYMRGTKELAKEGTKAVSLVNEAIQEANNYYDRKTDELLEWGRTSKDKIIDWYNNQISAINRELSYNDFTKAAAIKAARANAAQTLANINAQITQQKTQLATWLAQQKFAIDNAMAAAAAGKSETALDIIEKMTKNVNLVNKIGQAAAQGLIMGIPEEERKKLAGQGIWLPSTQQLTSLYQTEAEKDRLKNALMAAQAQTYGYGLNQETQVPFWQRWISR